MDLNLASAACAPAGHGLASPEASGSKFMLHFSNVSVVIGLASPEASGSKFMLHFANVSVVIGLASPEASGSKSLCTS